MVGVHIYHSRINLTYSSCILGNVALSLLSDLLDIPFSLRAYGCGGLAFGLGTRGNRWKSWQQQPAAELNVLYPTQ